jgi:RNA polymerase primary sigma factor
MGLRTQTTASSTETTSAPHSAALQQTWNLDAAHRLSAERINELLSEFQRTGDTDVRNQVVQANMRLVAYIAARFRSKGLSRDELISEGAAALLRATSTFDTTRGVSFATYASRAIEHSMRRAMGSAHEIVSIPSATRRQRAKERRAADAYFAEHGHRSVRHDGVLAGGPVGSVPLHAFPVALKGDGSEWTFDPTTEDTNETEAEDLRSRIRDAVAHLGPRRAAVVRLRFGLDTGTPRTWEEVARLTNMTTREAKSIAAEAMRALRVQLAPEQAELAFPGPSRGVAGAAA